MLGQILPSYGTHELDSASILCPCCLLDQTNLKPYDEQCYFADQICICLSTFNFKKMLQSERFIVFIKFVFD